MIIINHVLRFLSNRLYIFTLIIVGVISLYYRRKFIYKSISNKYDLLFKSSLIAEYWIKKERLERHEYKNQLAILYSISNEKIIKNKINEIINEDNYLNQSLIYELMNIPYGGLLGLFYDKTIKAREDKIDVSININTKSNGILSKIDNKKIKNLIIVIDYFYEKAIYVTKQGRKKKLIIEMYEVNNKVCCIISSTYRNNIFSIEKNDYFINKLLKSNHWINIKEELIEKYYVTTITIRQ